MLPKKYQFLETEGAPRMLVEALRHYGTLEHKGPGNNPSILKWAKEIGGKIEDVYDADEIAWCGLFMAIVAKRSGKTLPIDPLWALNWGTFGEKIAVDADGKLIVMLADVLVFVRKTAEGKRAGHVGLYVGEDKEAYHVFGGNQSDAVTITRILKSRLYTARRPVYSTAQPANVRRIVFDAQGGISTNEG